MDYLFEKYGYRPDKDSIDRNLEIIASNIDGAVTPEILRNCFGMMDLTSLKNTDTPSDIRRLSEAFTRIIPIRLPSVCSRISSLSSGRKRRAMTCILPPLPACSRIRKVFLK